MTFEEWFNSLDEYKIDPYRREGSDKWYCEDILRIAYSVGYSQGWEDGLDELKGFSEVYSLLEEYQEYKMRYLG